MNRFLLHWKVKTRPLVLHRVSRRDALIIMAVLMAVGGLLSATAMTLLPRLVNMFPLLAGRYGIDDDALALGVVAAYSLLLLTAMAVGNCLLRRFLSPH